MHFHVSNQRSLLPSATKLRRLCFYRRVSVHGGGGCLPQCMLGYHPPQVRHPPGQTPPREQTPPSPGADTPPGQTAPPKKILSFLHFLHPPSPPQDTVQETATAADGTHPTGMHSCYFMFVSFAEPRVFTIIIMGKYLVRSIASERD